MALPIIIHDAACAQFCQIHALFQYFTREMSTHFNYNTLSQVNKRPYLDLEKYNINYILHSTILVYILFVLTHIEISYFLSFYEKKVCSISTIFTLNCKHESAHQARAVTSLSRCSGGHKVTASVWGRASDRAAAWCHRPRCQDSLGSRARARMWTWTVK